MWFSIIFNQSPLLNTPSFHIIKIPRKKNSHAHKRRHSRFFLVVARWWSWWIRLLVPLLVCQVGLLGKNLQTLLVLYPFPFCYDSEVNISSTVGRYLGAGRLLEINLVDWTWVSHKPPNLGVWKGMYRNSLPSKRVFLMSLSWSILFSTWMAKVSRHETHCRLVNQMISGVEGSKNSHWLA